jgi:tRNA 2-thiouridine synthesizing protein A
LTCFLVFDKLLHRDAVHGSGKNRFGVLSSPPGIKRTDPPDGPKFKYAISRRNTMSIKTATPDQTLDTLGRVCPYPLLLTKKALEKLASGQTLKVLCDAPASAEDSIPRYAEKNNMGFEAVKIEDKGMWELYIKKG